MRTRKMRIEEFVKILPFCLHCLNILCSCVFSTNSASCLSYTSRIISQDAIEKMEENDGDDGVSRVNLLDLTKVCLEQSGGGTIDNGNYILIIG